MKALLSAPVTALLLCCLLVLPHPTLSQPRPSTCTQEGMTQCPMQGPFKFPTISNSSSSFITIDMTGCPPYKNPGWTNPSQACYFQQTYRIPVTPKKATTPIPLAQKLSVFENITYLKEDPSPLMGAVGVLMNGVNIFGVGSPCGYSSKCPDQGGPSKYVDAVEAEGHTVDSCGGHAAPTHQYHLHSGVGMTTGEMRQACELPQDTAGEHSQLLGWMFDGYGMYGQYSLNGIPPTDLDGCGGHTHSIKGVETYHYHMPYPTGFPWTIACYRGCPEVSNNPRQLAFTKNGGYGC